MSYVKLPQVCEDYGLGYQDVNQAADNCEALLALYDAKHGALEPPTGGTDPSPWTRVGKHDDFYVARTCLRVSMTQAGSVVTLTVEATGRGVLGVSRIGTGQYVIDLVGGVGLWRGFVQVEDFGVTTHHTTYQYQNQLYLTVWELSGTAFVAADFDFQVWVWGTGT